MSAVYADVLFKRQNFQLNVKLKISGRGVTALLGPSGSGKTTLLRALAGLERPRRGQIYHNDEVWFDSQKGVFVPPQRRGVGVVFQDYTLFPHMTVAENLGYGLPRKIRDQKANEWLTRLHLRKFAQRYPHQLSGGQRQRVALARVLARDPGVLLLDEPFSALDMSCRHHLHDELQRVLEGVSCPVLVVTHDIDEARYLADQVGVLVDGRLERFGDTADVFCKPHSKAVAQVLGWRNFLPVERILRGWATGGWGCIDLDHDSIITGNELAGCYLAIRPEHVALATNSTQGISAHVRRITDMGAIRAVECVLSDGTLIHMHRPWDAPVPAQNSLIRLHLPMQHVQVLSEHSTHASTILSDDAQSSEMYPVYRCKAV